MEIARFPSDRNPDPKVVIVDPKIMHNIIEIAARLLFITTPLIEIAEKTNRQKPFGRCRPPP